jgi:hypothetical protein
MKNFHFILAILTIIVLVAIGLIFIFGTSYSYTMSLRDSNWTSTSLYKVYLEQMNNAVIPFVVGLIILLGLCIPKRLFSGSRLLQVTAAIAVIALMIAIFANSKIAFAFLLLQAMIVQLVVIFLTITGSKRLSFRRQGFFIQMGSALLHLGLVVFLYDFILMPSSSYHLDIFWFSTIMIGVGMLFSFYHQPLSSLFRQPEIDSSIDF